MKVNINTKNNSNLLLVLFAVVLSILGVARAYYRIVDKTIASKGNKVGMPQILLDIYGSGGDDYE